jgi:hypothetical protein
MNTIQNYLDLVKEQDRTREAIALLQKATTDPSVFANLTSEFSKLKQLVSELDSDQSNVGLRLENQHGTIEKLEQVAEILNHQTE